MPVRESWVAACSHLAPKDASRRDPAPVGLETLFLEFAQLTGSWGQGSSCRAAVVKYRNWRIPHPAGKGKRETGIQPQWKSFLVKRALGWSGIRGFYTLCFLSWPWLHPQLHAASASANARPWVGSDRINECHFWNVLEWHVRALPLAASHV